MLHIRLSVGKGATNCYIVADSETREAALIDPGGNARGIREKLRENGLSLKYIFVTHGHFDHILALPELAADGATVVIHEADVACLIERRESLAIYASEAQIPRAADVHAHDGDEFKVGKLSFKFMHTPGHSRGSCIIICGDRIYSGDTLFKCECGRCDLPGGDYGQMLKSLKRIYELDGDFLVFPGHGAESTLEFERAFNPYMQKAAK